MKYLPLTALYFFITFTFSGCDSNKYSINREFIKGTSKNNGFIIAELIGDRYSGEKLRVCCEPNLRNNLTKKIFFNKKDRCYHWTFCSLDLKYVESDSLRNLSMEEKLEIIRKENNGKEISSSYDTLPIKFTPETWYHFFGFEDIEGSYFVYVKKDGTFKVEYFNEGPF